ncbi:MAG TPA: hypothetical protein VN778_02965, partial [Verrucomicrobiae bacterium]|nr:hypothetical protein [Verrucomicrobiae bacterium]
MSKKKRISDGDVSFALFFLLSTIGFSWLFAGSINVRHNQSLLAILGFSILVYVVWEIIPQLYSPGQSIILFFLTFNLLP